MLENLDLEQDYCARTATRIDKIGQDFNRIMKWSAYYDRSFHENIKYYGMMGSVLKCLNEVSQR